MNLLNIDPIDAEERIDNPNENFVDINISMSDVARTNKWFGGLSAVTRSVKKLLQYWDKSIPLHVLDIGTGSADIPEALIRLGDEYDVEIVITACDNQYKMLEIAGKAISPEYDRNMRFVQCNACALPFTTGSFDFVICSLLFHHIGFDQSVKVLADINRIARHGFVISDLRRNRLCYIGVKASLALINAHPITQHDGPLSVRRAFTFAEYRKMIALSGVNGIHLSSHWYFRVVMWKTGNVT